MLSGTNSTGSRELRPHKICKKIVRWNNTLGMNDEGTVYEAGTSDPSGRTGCQF